MEEKITTSKGLSPRSGEVQEIMGRAPHWTLRWGMLLIGVVFAGLAAGSWFFRYPDVLQAPCTVTPALLPEEIKAPLEAEITTVRVNSCADVCRGDTLCVLQDAKGNGIAVHTPLSGMAEADIRLLEGSMAKRGQTLFRITPARHSQKAMCVVKIPAGKAATVRNGMEVAVSLTEYPEESFGTVTCRIARISRIPDPDGTFAARADITLPLHTSKGRAITLTRPTNGTARIKLNNKRIFEKVFPISQNLQ